MTPRPAIAIVHFTSLPAVGGIENMLSLQQSALQEAGFHVRLITGSGSPRLDDDVHVVSGLVPMPVGTDPTSSDVEVQSLYDDLLPLLQNVDQCWVHNAFTVPLNPSLSSALLALVDALPDTEFVNWCSDISATSRYVLDVSARDLLTGIACRPRIVHVAVSDYRRRQLCSLLDLDCEAVRVIPPPVDAAVLLRLSEDSRAGIDGLELEDSSILILVPAKLLPHKNLELAVRLAAGLRERLPDVRLVITAAPSPHDGPSSASVRSRLETLRAQLGVEREVRFLADEFGSWADSSLVRDLMILSDLVFLPSTEEGFGMPILEAAALRVPIVCSDIPSFREVGRDGVTFFELREDVPRIVERVCAVLGDRGNQSRRRALASLRRFNTHVLELAHELGPAHPASRSLAIPQGQQWCRGDSESGQEARCSRYSSEVSAD